MDYRIRPKCDVGRRTCGQGHPVFQRTRKAGHKLAGVRARKADLLPYVNMARQQDIDTCWQRPRVQRMVDRLDAAVEQPESPLIIAMYFVSFPALLLIEEMLG